MSAMAQAASAREQSVDAESMHDDNFKDLLDDLTSVGDPSFHVFEEEEEEDWDEILGIADSSRKHANSTPSNGFMEAIESHDGESHLPRQEGDADPFAALDDGSYPEYSDQSPASGTVQNETSAEYDTGAIEQTGQEYTNRSELSGYSAGDESLVSNDLNKEEEVLEYDTEEDEEMSEPPPPPSSPPPPLDDELDFLDSTTDDGASHSSKANSLTQYSAFEDVVYHAGNDRDGFPVVVFLPGDVKTVLESNESPEADEFSKQESSLVNFFIEFVGEVAIKSPYTLVIAPADSTANFFQARRTFRKVIEILHLFPRHPHRKSLRKLVFLHPDPILAALLLAIKPLISSKFWKKLVFVRRVADLDTILQPTSAGEDVSLPLPENVLFYDITGAVGMDASSRGHASNTQGRQARVRAESEAPNPPSSFSGYWSVASSFGVPLATLAARTPFHLPAFVIRSVTFLCLHGVKTPGIFRVPGNADTVSYCKDMLMGGKDIDLGGYWSPSGRPATIEDVHVCAALLKTFVRDLPKPLLTHAAYSSIMAASEQVSDQSDLAVQIGQICALLPRPNRNLLQYLSYFMQFVLQHERFNQMTAQNLAIVWVPNLFRDEGDTNDPQRELRNLPHAMRAALTMFMHPNRVFPLDSSALLPVCYEQDTGKLLPVEEVCTRDATSPSTTQVEPLPLDEREFDGIAQQKQLTSAASFCLRAVVSDGVENAGSEVMASAQNSNGDPRTLSEVHVLSVKELKRFLVMNGYDPSGCVEKSDLRKMAIECLKAIRIKEGRSVDDLNEVPQTIARPPSGSTSSFDRLRRRRSSEGLISIDGSSGSKRGSDLGRMDRRESDVAFLAVLRQAGLQVDDTLSTFSINDDNVSVTSKGDSAPFSTAGGQKRDFAQVSEPGSSKLGSLSTMLRRKTLLTRDNKRDLSKSASALGGNKPASPLTPPAGSAQAITGVSSPDSDDSLAGGSVGARRRHSSLMPDRMLVSHLKRGSSFSGSMGSPSLLEETLRALKETPLFGEEESSVRERVSSQALPGSPLGSRGGGVRGSPKGSPLNARKSLTGSPRWTLQDVDAMGSFDLKTFLRTHRKEFREDMPVDELRNLARRVLFASKVNAQEDD